MVTAVVLNIRRFSGIIHLLIDVAFTLIPNLSRMPAELPNDPLRTLRWCALFAHTRASLKDSSWTAVLIREWKYKFGIIVISLSYIAAFFFPFSSMPKNGTPIPLF